MKIIVRCENCGNYAEVSAVTLGNVAYFAQELRNNRFDLNNAKIETTLLQETVTDECDVETRLKEIRIDCKECGQYICLDCE